MTETSSIWAVLLPVLIGGLLTLTGPMLSELLTQRRSRRQQRADDLRSLLASLYEHSHWLEMKRREKALGEPLEMSPDPLGKAVSLCCLEFPELLVDIQELEVASQEYEGWMIQSAMYRLEGRPEKIVEGFQEAFENYFRHFARFRTIVTEYAKPKPLSHRWRR